MPSSVELEKKISSNINMLVKSKEFQDWLNITQVNQGDRIVINNSVLYRSDIKTRKSTKYIGLFINKVNPLDYEIKIVHTQRKINDFTHISSKSNEPIIEFELLEEIDYELKSLGRLIFLLIGSIDCSEVFEQSIDHPLFNKLILDSSIKSLIEVRGQDVYIKDIQDAEEIWERLLIACQNIPALPNPLPDELIGFFSNAITELRKNSNVKLLIPPPTNNYSECFLDQVLSSLKQNIDLYSQALDSYSNKVDNNNEYFNILRISYTFAEEIIRFLRLFISISDLKPIIFWMTVFEQYQLSNALKELPWEKLGTKAELKSYVDAVKSARNKAFHNLLKFTQTIEVQLDGVTIRPTRLRLFSEFTSKGNTFEYEDKELVEILTEFTRAGEKYVTFDFWKRNRKVMESSLLLITSLSNALKSLNIESQ